VALKWELGHNVSSEPDWMPWGDETIHFADPAPAECRITCDMFQL
jgi:hypothetical protein